MLFQLLSKGILKEVQILFKHKVFCLLHSGQIEQGLWINNWGVGKPYYVCVQATELILGQGERLGFSQDPHVGERRELRGDKQLPQALATPAGLPVLPWFCWPV